MILNQDLKKEDDGTFRLLTTYDTGTAVELAQTATQNGGGRMGKGDGEMRLLGYIPPEEWGYDIFLIAAKEARNAGDMGEYVKYINKYFDFHTSQKVYTPKKYYNGSSSPKTEE